MSYEEKQDIRNEMFTSLKVYWQVKNTLENYMACIIWLDRTFRQNNVF
jgi:hypothetical protein